MDQYLKLASKIISNGNWKNPAREGMPRTKELFVETMRFDLKDGFPLLTTKKMYYKAIFTELLWFIKGDTNIKYLVDNGCNIWNKDAYKWYLRKCAESNVLTENIISFEDFISGIKEDNYPSKKSVPENYNIGDLGKVYGYQWRRQNKVDQLKRLADGIKNNPDSRYHILDAWNVSDFEEMALPPCHLLYQFSCRKNDYGALTLDMFMYQRSCDFFLGVPFNIASGALFLTLISEVTGMLPGTFTWTGGSVHIYENHFSQIRQQIERIPMQLPKLKLHGGALQSIEDLEKLEPENIKLIDYTSHPSIKGELSVGV